MSYTIIRSAIEKKLITLSGIPDVSWENVEYDQTIGTPFLRCNLVPTTTVAAAIGPNANTRYDGIVLLDIFEPDHQGAQAADTIADNLTSLFKWGTILTESGKKITILKSERGKAQQKAPWYMIPMVITWYAYI